MRYSYKATTASGRRTSWAKLVTDIDKTARGAKAFGGRYLREGQQVDLSEGDLILDVIPEGSAKGGCQTATLYVVESGELAEKESFDWREEFFDLLDAAEFLGIGGAIQRTREQAVAAVKGALVGLTDSEKSDAIAQAIRELGISL